MEVKDLEMNKLKFQGLQGLVLILSVKIEEMGKDIDKLKEIQEKQIEGKK